MLGLSGALSYALFAYLRNAYLCICSCVFVYETLGNISFDILGPRVFRYAVLRVQSEKNLDFLFLWMKLCYGNVLSPCPDKWKAPWGQAGHWGVLP